MAHQNRLQSKFSAPEESPGYLLWQVSNQWQRHLRAALKELDLTHVQFVLLANLVWLEDQGQEANQALLSKQTSMDKMMVSEVVRTLEKKLFVQRKVNPTDARAFYVRPTLKGIKIAQKAIKIVENADDVFFSRSPLPRKSIVECFKSLSTS